MLTAARLRELLTYDPETGDFTRLVRGGRHGQCAPGTKIGRIGSGGYVFIFVDGDDYLAHRLAWLYMKGEWPPGLLDHHDRNRANNCFDNVRAATPTQSCANTGVRTDSLTGLKGVNEYRPGRFRARIATGRRQRMIGTFRSAEEAHAAYVAKAKEVFGEFHCAG